MLLLLFFTLLFPISQYTRSNKYNNDTINSKDKQKQVKQFITHQHTQQHRHIQARTHTHNHIHIQTDTYTHTHIYPHTHTHTYTKNVLSTMAEYIYCKLPYAKKRVKAPIEVYTIHTYYHCIIHILHSKSMIPSKSGKTATPL